MSKIFLMKQKMGLKYHSKEALKSQINDITKQINIIVNIPGNHLGYTDAMAITINLNKLRNEYKRQLEE